MIGAGTKFGPYEISSPLGAGGMGEVYRARDTRLGRDVAIKVLPQHLSSDPDLKARFEREARAISALSHPHICHLYDIGSQDGTDFIVMELLEGESLADRLQKGAMPLKQALDVGIQIAEALEKAHKQGIVHRDLKPGNIMLTKSGAKLLDFGLAKPQQSMAAMASASAETMSKPLTDEGKIVGTYQYMAPEQIQGHQADARTDIFALGAVLYEMVTGKRAFRGKSQISVMSAILEKEPEPITAAQPLSPPALDHVIRRALAKERDERWQSASDFKGELRWIAEAGSQSSASLPLPLGRKRLGQAGWVVAGLLLLAIIAGGVSWWTNARNAAPAMYFSTPFRMASNNIALSPDGRTVALVAYSEQANKYLIWAYEVGSRQATVIPGTEDATHPFWSPDGRFIAFFSQGKLKRVEVAGGKSAQVLCDAPHGRGGTWNRDGVIIFTPEVWVGLYRVSADGGTPAEITKPDLSRFEQSHRWPMFLPDGRHFIYLAANFSGQYESNTLYVGSLDSGEKRSVVQTSANAAYVEPGYLLYLRDKALVAQKFDARNYVLSGESRIINDEVQYLSQIDLALFSVAGAKTLLIQTGRGADKSQLVWFDRSGKQIGTAGGVGQFANPSLSPDGRHVAFDQTDKDGRHQDIWTRELANDSVMRLTFGPGQNELPVWTPDGRHIAFQANRNLGAAFYQKNADGSGAEQQMGKASPAQQAFWDWSRDGKYILIWHEGELWYMSWPSEEVKPLFKEKWIVRNAQFSPDGKWIAYSSNETGNWEIYVSPFPNPTSKWLVSSGGGEEPRWRRDGKELFYLSPERKMMAVPVKLSSTFEAAPAVTLFQAHLRQPIASPDVVTYDVSADGQRFLINSPVSEPNSAPLSVVLNWASEMQR